MTLKSNEVLEEDGTAEKDTRLKEPMRYANGYKVFFWGGENVLKLDSGKKAILWIY